MKPLAVTFCVSVCSHEDYEAFLIFLINFRNIRRLKIGLEAELFLLILLLFFDFNKIIYVALEIFLLLVLINTVEFLTV